MGWFIWFGLLRLRARWRSLVTLIVGVLLAALIGANASLYTTAISQAGLVQFLAVQATDDTNILARFSVAPFDQDRSLAAIWSDYDQQIVDAVRTTFADLDDWVASTTTYIETQAFITLQDGEDLQNTRLRVAYYDDLAAKVDLVSGRLPQEPSNPEIQAEVVLNAEAAVLLGITTGDSLQLDQRGWDTSRIFTVQVVGLVVPSDPDDGYWFAPSPLRFDSGSSIETNLLTTRTTMETLPGEYVPQTTVVVGWRVTPQYAELPYTRINSASQAVDEFELALNDIMLQDEALQSGYVFATNIPGLMAAYDEQILFLNIPFSLLILQLSALVLFFLILIAALIRRGERREIALFQSRGATDIQVVFARSVESLVICVAATLVAPVLARLLLQQFIPLLTGIDQIPLEITAQSYLYAGLASLFAFIALTVTLYPVMRLPLVSAGGSGTRGSKQTIWQKYYIDVILLIIGTGALYQLTQSQSVVASKPSGTTQVDPLLLVAPTLLFVAFSSVLLRFFPVVMSLIANFYADRRGIEAALASWQVSRQPLHYGRIAFLLALAIGLGWFAVSYQATIIGNQSDQASYLVGGDARIIYANPDSPEVAASMRRISQLPQVAASTLVTRYELQSVITASGGGRRSRQSGELLAINDSTFREVVAWRDDLGSLSLPQNDFDATSSVGVSIPQGTQRIGIWAQAVTDANVRFRERNEALSPYPPVLLQENLIRLRLQDDSGFAYSAVAIADAAPIKRQIDELQSTLDEDEVLWQPVDTDGDGTVDVVPRYEWENDGWVYLEADLTQVEYDDNLSLLSYDVVVRPNPFFTSIELTIGAIQFIDASNQTTLVDYSGQDLGLQGLQNAIVPDGYENLMPENPDAGQEALKFEFEISSGFDAQVAGYSILYNYPQLSTVTVNSAQRTGSTTTEETLSDEDIIGLPALVSREIVTINEMVIDQKFNLVVNNTSPWFTVDRIVDYYPTLYQERPYIIVDAGALNFSLQRATGQGIPPNELWIRLNPNVSQAQFLSDLRLSEDATLFSQVIGFDEVIQTFETDVLALGVIGLLFISFIIGLALSLVSLLTYISLTVQSRTGEFAVLQALGMTTSRLIYSILIEQVLVLLASILLGAIIGQFLSLQVLPPLVLSAAGGVVTPPFTLIIDWFAIAQYLGIMVLVLVIVLSLTAIGIRRVATAETLRLPEE